MPKTQTNPSQMRRLLGWFGRHKIFAGFTVLIALLLLLYGVSALTYKFQGYMEEKRFAAAADEMTNLEVYLSRLGPTHISYNKSCQHSNFGGVFENDTIYCSTGVQSIYLNASNSRNTSILEKSQQLLKQQGFQLKPSNINQSGEKLASYTFSHRGLTCFFDAWFYDQSTPTADRDSTFPAGGTETETQILCGGKTQKDYFAVSN